MHFPSAAVPCVSPFSRKLQVWFHPAGQNPGQIPHPVLSLPPAIPARSGYPVVTFYKNSAWTAPMQLPACHLMPCSLHICFTSSSVVIQFRLLWLSLLSIVGYHLLLYYAYVFSKSSHISKYILQLQIAPETDTPAQTFQVSVATCLSEQAYSFFLFIPISVFILFLFLSVVVPS